MALRLATMPRMNPRLLRRLALAIALTLALAWLALRSRDDSASVLERHFPAMGTDVRLVLPLPADSRRAAATAALDAAQARLIAFGRDWAPWGDGALADMNRRLAAGERIFIPDDMTSLWTRSEALRAGIGGGFEPRIGALVRLWGFDEAARLPAQPPSPPDIAKALQALQQAPPASTACGADRCYGPAPGVQWDFGAVAKGWIVDRVLEDLAAAGFGDALVDAGGNLALRGRRGERAWRVAIRHPRGDGTALPRWLATLDARDEAINTHGDYERYFDYAGRRYGHVLDPQTGEPAQGLASLTVIHADAAYADAAGAALFVAGPQHWRERARALGLTQVLVVDAQSRLFATPAMAARLQLEPGLTLETVP